MARGVQLQRTPELMRPKDLREFASYAMSACRMPPPNVRGILMFDDDEPGMLAIGVPEDHDPPDTEDMFTGRTYAAMATKTRWSPSEIAPFIDAWMLVCVRRHETALFLVGPMGKADASEWTIVSPLDAPWFALSIAGSLRAALDGKPMVWKETRDRRLLHKPGEMEPPPVDAEGRI